MALIRLALLALTLVSSAHAIRYGADNVGYNLNLNKTAINARDYSGAWENHSYNPSPTNWRFPFYALTLDRYIDGDPTNNEANDTVFEHDWMTTQFRFGGDVAGVLSDLDYIQGLGIKAIYFTGSMFLNMPWSADGYGPLDFTLLDRHHGDIQEWQSLITEIHNRNMYVVFDNTMATMGNLLAYGGSYTNISVPFTWDEHDFEWKYPDRQYHDFHPSNTWNESCEFPQIWEQDGYTLPQDIAKQQHGCRASDFNMFGDIKGTGSYESYINQLSRFASVQDRLKEWQPDVLEKINIMSCMQISMLDIDGFRMDKAVQTTLDALAEFSSYQRQCARDLGKDNFLVIGEIVANPFLTNTYIGRGKQPDQALDDFSASVYTSNITDPDNYMRPFGNSALDGSAFHYDIYGSMTRFLGLDGPWGGAGVDWTNIYNTMILGGQDLVNANTGVFDPRHVFGTSNQDVFRWPALANGTQRQLLGLFITTLFFPGIPQVYFGEEQAHGVLESTAADYVFGRAPMASSQAWQIHGCHTVGEDVYVDMPFNSSKFACHDDTVSLDHRDPSHPFRNYLKRMFEMRIHYPTLNDGYNITTLSTRIENSFLPGSGGLASPHGLWSIYRGRNQEVQDFTGIGQGNQGIWLVYSNENVSKTFNFDCTAQDVTGPDSTLVSAFAAGTTIKNLFYPYEEYTLRDSTSYYFIENSTELNGCLPQLVMKSWDFKAFVPKSAWIQPNPVITNVSPRHDSRIRSAVDYNATESVTIQIEFSSEMDCDSIADNLVVDSTTQTGAVAVLNKSSVTCALYQGDASLYPGYVQSAWIFTAKLDNVANGVHTYTVHNATTSDGVYSTGTRDKFMFRIGQPENPMIFSSTSNYTTEILHKDSTGQLYVSAQASGADKFRYSTNFGSSFSAWIDYTDADVAITKQDWSGTKDQEWSGEHVVLNYWSKMTASSMHVQHADLDWGNKPARRWPHAWIEGDWNQWGFDAGVKNQMSQSQDGNWTFDLYTEWPTAIMVNVWGVNPDGQVDKSGAFGDVDNDNVLDWLPPDPPTTNIINMSSTPARGYLGYRLVVNDGNHNYHIIPVGSQTIQVAILVLLCIIPILTAITCVFLFIQFFYRVKFNKVGIKVERNIHLFWTAIWTKVTYRSPTSSVEMKNVERTLLSPVSLDQYEVETGGALSAGLAVRDASEVRRSVLIATMEYEISDWNVKIKIGGLGVMSTLMGNNLRHQDLIWVVPCLGDVDYPLHGAVKGEVMRVTVLGQKYEVKAYYHVSDNITYVVLDAPIFRKRTKAEPYPERMDDLESGIYYSTWNQCIAITINRFKPDIYHINDYHGALAPLYLLPEVIPCCLSLHNAEFQGLWNLKSARQTQETCSIFNLSLEVVQKYVQYGEVFNLLHAAASYLRIHQRGFGAVGVSKKYGKRSLARYPIFWGLHKIGSLPNPDPTDTAPLNRALLPSSPEVKIDLVWEEQRSEDRRQAQEWAGLNVDKKADLFIFVGRWSNQKGVDLIADVFFSVLKENPSVQLMCIGPVIDLHGKFAALKLSKLMDHFPGRVYSKPEFTMLPPYIFSGAEFALMPSRDEPFGLVAVEFGRKGALCVGSRVGGFGNMPGWWFTVESVTTKHLLHQFKAAISSALASDRDTRTSMRAYSKLQRFPVAQWVEDLEILQSRSIDISTKVRLFGEHFYSNFLNKNRSASSLSLSSKFSGRTSPRSNSGNTTPIPTAWNTPAGSRSVSRNASETDLRTLAGSPSDHMIMRSPLSGFRAGSRTEIRSDMDSRASSRATSRNANRTIMFATPEADEFEDDDDTTVAESQRIIPSRRLSLGSVSKGVAGDSSINLLSPIFNDKLSVYYDKYSEKLDKHLDAKSSEGDLCIQEYLVASEKKWFNNYHDASLRPTTRAKIASSTIARPSKFLTWLRSIKIGQKSKNRAVTQISDPSEYDDFFGNNYAAPRGAKKILQSKVGSWPLYCFLLAIGQVISANSYQLTLLTGQAAAPENQLYILSSIYLLCSGLWWMMYRNVQAFWVLSLPFLFFGLCFFLLGISIAVTNTYALGWVYYVASGFYTIGSSAGTMFFALNFGTEGGTPSQTWAFRACAIAGTQQLLVAFLWYWGSYLISTNGSTATKLISSPAILTAVTIPLALLMWTIGLLLFYGLPKYYRQTPGAIPSFYGAVSRRGVVMWFWIYVVLQTYWLSPGYNRNWQFLWSSTHAPRWAVVLIVLLFFVVVWATGLVTLALLSKSHSWIIPIFAIGLGAPRWCQYMWSMSGIGFYLPWTGSLVGGALLSRSLWCWLGVLDAIQGVGFGMILLMTLTRTHITFTLVMSQMIGALVTIIARATAPNRISPSSVFINFASDSLASWGFWLALICQLVICVGFFKFFRKAQLQKP